LEVRGEVAEAISSGAAVVALESTVFAHGLPHPHNLESAAAMAAAVRAESGVPATVGLFDGQVIVGLTEPEIEALAEDPQTVKVSIRDLAPVLAAGRPGATTVAATIWAAGRVGIPVVATGGIGGVHRGGELSLDVSADLTELARTQVAVVCSGAKAVLDLERTLESLETLGVPVIGYGTDELPAFYARESGLSLESTVGSPYEAAAVMAAQWRLGLPAGIVFANPPPADRALDRADLESLIESALGEVAGHGVTGKDVTPYLLEHLARASGGRTLDLNVALLVENARVAAGIAVAFSRLG
jgi:pseudouridine-5'-phosphate glycosidase